MTVTLHVGDCRDILPTLPAESVQCVVTSPPYWGLRDYGLGDDQLGLEPTPELYVSHLVAIFRQVRRVLREDGVVWLNLGDSYAANRSYQVPDSKWRDVGNSRGMDADTFGLKPKDLVGIPWRVAFALQEDGWWLRSDIIWHKPNCMPESVTDRPTKAHEYVFLLSKAARYYYDADAVREPYELSSWTAKSDAVGTTERGQKGIRSGMKGKARAEGAADGTQYGSTSMMNAYGHNGRNRRTVWTIPTRPFPGSHFAVMPTDLVKPCILAGSSERGCCPACGAPWQRVVERTDEIDPSAKGSRFDNGKTAKHQLDRAQEGERYLSQTTGWLPTCSCVGDCLSYDPIPCTILDPFSGAGTVGLVADQLGRDAVLIELNPTYADMAEQRIRQDAPLFVEVIRP